MTGSVYHFSGTGNSLKIARSIAKCTGGAELIPMAKAEGEKLSVTGDLMGIVFPVYAWGPPTVVLRFLESVAVQPDTYVFAVCTCAASAGGTLSIVEKTLAKKNVELSSGFVIKMPSNYIVWQGAIPVEQQQKMFHAAAVRVAEVCNVVAEKKKMPVEKGNVLGRFFFNSVYRLWARHSAGSDRKFQVNDNCNSCGLCSKVCQVGNVKLSEGKPVWGHRCEACLACLQWCPQNAIQYGKNTAGRKQYHHPDIKALDISSY